MHARVLFKLALLAPPLYLAAVVWGSWITPGYSHRHQAISELTQRGAANTGPVEALFVLSALCVAALGAGVLRLWGADHHFRLADLARGARACGPLRRKLISERASGGYRRNVM